VSFLFLFFPPSLVLGVNQGPTDGPQKGGEPEPSRCLRRPIKDIKVIYQSQSKIGFVVTTHLGLFLQFSSAMAKKS